MRTSAPQASLLEGLYGAAHVRHGCSQQGRHAQYVRTLVNHFVNELVRLGVDTQVVNHEPCATEHHYAEVLTYVVEIALNRAHDHCADRFDPGR